MSDPAAKPAPALDELASVRAVLARWSTELRGEPSELGQKLQAAGYDKLARRLAQAAIPQLLAVDDGFLVTLDHRRLVDEAAAAEQPLKGHRAEAAAVLASLAPHAKTTIAAGRVGVELPRALTTSVDCAPSTGGAQASSSASLLQGAKRAMTECPGALVSQATPSAVKAVMDAVNSVTGLLVGSSGINPGRSGVSIFVSDVLLADAGSRGELEALCFLAAAKLCAVRRWSPSSDLTSALDAALAALRQATRVVDDRTRLGCAAAASRLAFWVSQGELDGALSAQYEVTKEPPAWSATVASVLLDGKHPPSKSGLETFDVARLSDSATVPFPQEPRQTPDAVFAGAPRNTTAAVEDDAELVSASRAEVATSALERVAGEVDFGQASSTARDVDRLFMFARHAMEGHLPSAALAALCEHRVTDEPRPLLPVRTALTADVLAVGSDNDDDEAAQDGEGARPLLPLERVAVALAADQA